MMPKLIALARRRTSLGMSFDRHAEHLRRRHGVDVEAFGERLLQLRDVGDVREHAQLDLADSRPRSASCPSSAMKAVRISRPSLVRIGNVLQVGIGRGEAPVVVAAERIAGVDAPGRRD